jgi:2-polyprenyl-3-methyl-5-hydroxy-6-metoxy-1,4-benzoquinol methylase
MNTHLNETDLLNNLRPLMEKYGVRCSPRHFYDAVNIHFHAAESKMYDEVHRDMWQSLPRQFALLTNDCVPYPQKSLRVLDIGSGTGLSTELFLGTALGSRTSEVHLLDTSPEMLEIARKRGKRWRVEIKTHCCSIDGLPATLQYDVIIACSVLHHIADLAAFFDKVRSHQSANGIFLHFQDPNADCASDQEYLSRISACDAITASQYIEPFVRKLKPKRIFRRLVRTFGGSNDRDYIGATNKSLIKSGVINKNMDAGDIWLVTDIRISPYSNGVSLTELSLLLPQYDLISTRSYSFYGRVGDYLPAQFHPEETRLIEAHALNGHCIAGAWRRRAG